MNICDMAPCIEGGKLTLMKKQSVSKSETMTGILTVNNEKVSVVIKIFPIDGSPSSLSLVYESNVYRYITDNVLKRKLSPNFVGLIAYGVCGDTNLQTITTSEDYDMIMDVYGSDKFGYLITRKVDKPIPLHKIAKKHKDVVNGVLFQILYNLEVMRRVKIVHNDLHPYNILIDELENYTYLTYQLGDDRFSFYTRYLVYFFDWDSAYCQPLGDNPKLLANPDLCMMRNNCNELNYDVDLFNAVHEFEKMPLIIDNVYVKTPIDYLQIVITKSQARKFRKLNDRYAHLSISYLRHQLTTEQFQSIPKNVLGARCYIDTDKPNILLLFLKRKNLLLATLSDLPTARQLIKAHAPFWNPDANGGTPSIVFKVDI